MRFFFVLAAKKDFRAIVRCLETSESDTNTHTTVEKKINKRNKSDGSIAVFSVQQRREAKKQQQKR